MQLYKYVRPERINILEDLTIRFTQPNELNDPFELLLNMSTLIKESQYRDFLRPLLVNGNIQEDFHSLLPNAMENLPFLFPVEKHVIHNFLTSSNLSLLFEALLNPIVIPQLTAKQPGLNFNLKNDLNKRFGILSLTTRNDNITMWSHYAFDHKGIVIELNPRSHIFHNNKSKIKLFRSLRKVSYKRHRPSATLLDSLASPEGFSNLLKKVFLTKSNDWKYEQEIRMLTTLNDADVREVSTGIFVKDLEPSSILNVFFGVKSDIAFKDKIMAILANPDFSHVGAFQGKVHEEEYKVIFERI